MNVVSELEAAGGRLWRRVDALAEHSGCDKLRAASGFCCRRSVSLVGSEVVVISVVEVVSV